MIKRSMLLVAILMLLSVQSVAAAGTTKVNVNGVNLVMKEAPVIINGRTLVPLRAIFEALNVSPQWDGTTKTVSASTGNVTMQLKIGSNEAIVNGKTVKLDAPGTLVNGSTMVPARFVAETLGGNVGWDDATKTVKITTSVAANQTPIAPQPPQQSVESLYADAYKHMKNYMNQYSGSKFSAKASLGSVETLRQELLDTKIVVDTTMDKDAQYDPKTNTITLSKDPSTIPEDKSLWMGQLVWHEVCHKREDTKGDTSSFTSKEYDERNVEVMKYLYENALKRLEILESYKGTDEAVIKELWKKFELSYDNVMELPEAKQYPPNYGQMKEWFGFDIDKAALLEFYKNGGGGEAIKNALNAKPAANFSGAWKTNFGALSMTQSGNAVTGTYSWDAGGLKGTVNGNVLTGTWDEGSDRGTFTFTLASDGKSFDGSWRETSPDPSQGGRWDGTKQ